MFYRIFNHAFFLDQRVLFLLRYHFVSPASWWETDDESGSESEELGAESEDEGGVAKGDDESSQTAGDGNENTDTSKTKRVNDEGADTSMKGGDPEVGNGDEEETAAVQSTGKARDMDRDAEETSVDRSETASSKPGTLCPFCDEPLPPILSSALTSELLRLMSISVPDPLPDNPLHRCLSIQHHAVFCSRHEYERKEIPKAKTHQWPLDINFYALHRRIENFQDELEAIMDDLTGSQFYKISRDSFSPGSSGGKPGPMRGFDTLDTQGAGYYGEKGFALMVEALESMFPEASYNFDAYKPVTWRAAIEEILTPEVTIMLIVEDMGVSEEEAAQIRTASRVFGIHANPIEDNPADQPAKIKEELVEPAVAEGALIDLTTPPTSPRPEAVVKTEPVEGTLKISEYNGEVIDLTLTDDEL
ncbi:hypothetical protein D9611_011462 [Ephemerocybe angulata]|uniref:Restriction of telomere capping protein 4 n=1 Tax=Ephemerocybe angulata TaxID=980116 RepID=A0A8H5FJY0_9AGAR|nr:hypothetical protein D9611_011462 [Tulosesus angulatus]